MAVALLEEDEEELLDELELSWYTLSTSFSTAKIRFNSILFSSYRASMSTSPPESDDYDDESHHFYATACDCKRSFSTYRRVSTSLSGL